MGVNLTAAWVEIETLVGSLRPLIHEIASGKDDSYNHCSLAARERLQKVVQLCQLARQASNQRQAHAASQQLQCQAGVSAPVGPVSQAVHSGAVRAGVISAPQYQMPLNPDASAMQQAHLQAFAQHMGMPPSIQAAQAGYAANTMIQQGQALMGVPQAQGPFGPGASGPRPLLNPTRPSS